MNTAASNDVSEKLSELSKKELGNISVFVVEDDKMISELIITKLMKSGCIPYSTNDGLEAVSLAQRYMPDAIILDLMLPGMSGEDILMLLKSKNELKDTPVIVFSNKSEESDRQKVLSLGASQYFVKASTDLNDLIAEIKKLVNEKRQTA